MSTSSEDDEVFIQGPVPAPPDPTPIARPTLQARDVVLAVRSVFSRKEAQLLVPTMVSEFATNLSATELAECLEWLWLMRMDVATHTHDVALRLLHQPPEHTLSELIQLLEALAADLQ